MSIVDNLCDPFPAATISSCPCIFRYHECNPCKNTNPDSRSSTEYTSFIYACFDWIIVIPGVGSHRMDTVT